MPLFQTILTQMLKALIFLNLILGGSSAFQWLSRHFFRTILENPFEIMLGSRKHREGWVRNASATSVLVRLALIALKLDYLDAHY